MKAPVWGGFKVARNFFLNVRRVRFVDAAFEGTEQVSLDGDSYGEGFEVFMCGEGGRGPRSHGRRPFFSTFSVLDLSGFGYHWYFFLSTTKGGRFMAALMRAGLHSVVCGLCLWRYHLI